MKELRRILTDAAGRAKSSQKERVARGRGDPYYSVSTHKTRFEKYEELMNDLFGPVDVSRGTKRKRPQAKLRGADGKYTGVSFDTRAVAFESSSSREPTPADVEEMNRERLQASIAMPAPDAIPPTRLNLFRGAVKTTLPSKQSLSEGVVHETPVADLKHENSSAQPEAPTLAAQTIHSGQIGAPTVNGARLEEDFIHLHDVPRTPPAKQDTRTKGLSELSNQGNGSPIISIASNDSQPDFMQQVSYFNIDEWKITLQRFIKGKGPAVSQPDVIAVLQIFTSIESMVDAAKTDPVVQNLVLMLREYLTAIQKLPDGHIPSGDPFHFRARASSILSLSIRPGQLA
ncbi:hypothetical protein SCHPADRAFT_388980 [Schizopora paradoxa]|uniref:Uncharacterized protein n=1 Tax=Schizopora paradoxa TaxID=27342 RepID=A0A0H2RN47_9AGAM|nr:hypothetical protein SCHPADRAFT_388980 [Schizopora paradoxa]